MILIFNEFTIQNEVDMICDTDPSTHTKNTSIKY